MCSDGNRLPFTRGGRLFAGLALLGVALAAGTVPAAEIATAPVVRQTVADERRYDGVVEAVHQSTVSAETSGRIVEILYDVDDTVERGAVIVRFRDTGQQARLKAAEGEMQEAQARLKQAEAEFRRIEEIYRKKLISKSALDKAEAELKAARARLKSAEARLADAREQLEHTVVRAPYSGIVTERHVEVGELAKPGQPLMSGISLEHLRVLARVPQYYIEAVRRLKRAQVYPVPGDGEPITVERLTVFPYADPETHSFKVRAWLPARVAGLYPGMLVKVGFTVGEREQLVVPAAAVVYRSELTAVYVLDDDGRLSFRQVRVGPRVGDQRVILAGLETGEQVAVDPQAAAVAYKRQRAGD